MAPSTLSIANLTVTTQKNGEIRKLVDGLSLDIASGRVLALVGASGSGKSLSCAACLDVLPAGVMRQSGQVTLDGAGVDFATLRGRIVSSIMQNPRSAFNPVMTMKAHARETLKALGLPRDAGNARLIAAFEDVGLEEPEHILDLHPFEMSGGMLQRVMIALALLGDPPFLFADEPTTDLDLVVQKHILDLLEGVVMRRGMGILLVTHDMGVVARLADDVAVMDAGKIVEQAPVHQVFERPSHQITRNLVAAHLSLYGQEVS
ncbi:nickel ABC transporter ATP-binding protein [Thalassospira profundimaris]|uniref:Nickel ABC transporter ATP-binding protein n=1 Tax=Thalassospira profundimaris TaxID=502049 RepID=A0A367X8F1_9PROT|nr:nickel import ATP-binding protein NikD [Thalassospira profundimaris]RCK49857.1 nickel ABC transporter ATP-binding protein [Thalassospira profundimaris]